MTQHDHDRRGHASWCTEPNWSEWVGRRGDRMAHCTGCGRNRIVETATHAPEHTPEAPHSAEEATPRPVPRYVCRDHHEPVRRTPRGYAVGCPTCRREGRR